MKAAVVPEFGKPLVIAEVVPFRGLLMADFGAVP
jgi:hypothetical protein